MSRKATVGSVVLSKEEKDLIADCLIMRKNYIETGTITLSANDAAMMFNKRIIFPPMKKIEIKPLDREQMELILKLEKLREYILKE